MNFLLLRRTPKLAVPKHETEILFADADGVLKQMGPDGSVVEVGSGGGGGSIPVPSLEDFIAGPNQTVTNGGNANLAWHGTGHGSDLVDLSDTTEPLVIVGGIYAVSVGVNAVTDMSVGGFFDFNVQLDADGTDLSVGQESRLATAAKPRPGAAQTVVGYIPTGGGIIVTMHNWDGASSVDFTIGSAFIQRIT